MMVSVVKTIKKDNGIIIEELEDGTVQATTESSNYIIIYDRNICIGAASCAAIAPETFFMDDENRAIINPDSSNFDDDDIILAAAQSCPVFAIKIIKKDTGEQIFPIE